MKPIRVIAATLAVLACAAAATAGENELPCGEGDRDCLIGILETAKGGPPIRAAVLLGEIGDEDSLSALGRALASTDEMLATAALHALIENGEKAAPTLIAASKDGRQRVREYAAYGLARVGNGYTLDDVLPLARDPKIPVRMKAIDLLLVLGCEQSFSTLAEMTEDHAIKVRARAVDAVAQCDMPESMEILVFAMGDLYPLVGDTATRALAARGKAAMPFLTRLLASGRSHVRIRACAAIGTIGDPSANATLVRMIDNPDVQVARAAIQTLGATGGKAELRALRYLRDPDRLVDGVPLGKYAEKAMFSIAARIKKDPIPLPP